MTDTTNALATVEEVLAAPTATADREPQHSSLQAVARVLLYSLPQWRWLVLCIGLSFAVSALQALTLVALNAGLSTLAGDVPAAGRAAQWAIALVVSLGLDAPIALFTLSTMVGIVAFAIDHLGGVARMAMLARYEQERVAAGLRATAQYAASGVAGPEFVQGIRVDCKGLRLILQVLILNAIVLVMLSCPIIYMFSLNAELAALSLGIMLCGLFPIVRLTRASGTVAARRMRRTATAGSETAGVTQSWEENALAVVKAHHRFTDKHYALRDLSAKVLLSLSLVSTYVVFVFGVHQIRSGAMTGVDLITFLMASRIFLQPFGSSAARFAKVGAHLPHARRYLALVDASCATAVPRLPAVCRTYQRVGDLGFGMEDDQL